MIIRRVFLSNSCGVYIILINALKENNGLDDIAIGNRLISLRADSVSVFFRVARKG